MPLYLIYLLAFLEGALIVLVELLAGHMLAPLYGSSLSAWAALIAVVIGSMALAYFMSARISGTERPRSVLIRLLVPTGLYLLALALFANKLEGALFDQSRFYLSLFGTIFSLAAIPAFLLAMTPSLLIHQLNAYLRHPGKAAGRIFFISTLGAVISCFVTGFVLLPALGITACLKLAAILLLVPAPLLFTRRIWLALVLLLVCVSTALVFPRKKEKSGWVKVLEKSEGINGQLLVLDAPRGLDLHPNYSRILFVNRMGQGYVDRRTGDPLWSYVDHIVYLCAAKGPAPKVLVLGLGAGTLAGRLMKNVSAEVDVVEFDPRIASAAKRYFNLPSRANVIIDDARHYLNTCTKKYDFIVFDLFKGELPPTHVMTTEALAKARTLLEENGMAVINYSGFLHGKLGRDTRSIMRTVGEVFGPNSCKVIFTPEEESTRNSLILGLQGNIHPDSSYINLMAYGKAVKYQQAHIPYQSLDLSDALLLTDNRPVLEYLHQGAGLAWRKDFYTNFTKKYLKEGITLFD